MRDSELEDELERITDHEVDKLFGPVVGLGGVMLVNSYSRLVIDPERFRADEEEPAAAFGAGAVYSGASDGTCCEIRIGTPSCGRSFSSAIMIPTPQRCRNVSRRW